MQNIEREQEKCTECGKIVHTDNIYTIEDNDSGIRRDLCEDCWDIVRKQDPTLEGHGSIIEETKDGVIMTDMQTFILDNSDTLFRYLVYKKMFTPFEIDRKYRDESLFDDQSYSYGYIVECIELPNQEILLGIKDEDDIVVSYYTLPEIRLYKFKDDGKEDVDGNDE